jgi:hypothetical protein
VGCESALIISVTLWYSVFSWSWTALIHQRIGVVYAFIGFREGSTIVCARHERCAGCVVGQWGSCEREGAVSKRVAGSLPWVGVE